MSTEVTTDPTWQTVSVHRPWRGLSLLGISAAATLVVLVYFGAWLADGRIEARNSDSSVAAPANAEGEWWEDGLIAICPIH